ncbi:HSP20-like chaperone [Wolfiporia cocos MD-104 SS10]|uniref:HSP20-like chaperone n=1 Tax=Wolfiporia cocos (strain MD-104) TaxID=742152 RepID=A0A2H3JJV2_WOLCO|nr:HSP20-like chaperone [Wolfiporia cocos MD-104 SS10]
MSLARHFFHEMRPLFRMLEEPFGRTPAFGAFDRRSPFDDPFFRAPSMLQPAVDVTEEGNNYVIEAELPGVKKENISVRIGDGGRSVTIEGKVVSRRGGPRTVDVNADSSTSTEVSNTAGEGSKAVTTQPEENALSTERFFSGTSSFARTVYLPRPVDSSNVSAKLSDGILTVSVPKAEDPASVQVPIE